MNILNNAMIKTPLVPFTVIRIVVLVIFFIINLVMSIITWRMTTAECKKKKTDCKY